MNIYVQHALSLSLEDRMEFLRSLKQSIGELEPLLYDDQAPEDRMTLHRIIVNSRHALRELGYDVLPRYNLNAEYEDSPPEYSHFVRLPVSVIYRIKATLWRLLASGPCVPVSLLADIGGFVEL